MKILFECKSIHPNYSGGIENYTYMLVNAWRKYFPQDHIVLNIPPETKRDYIEHLGNDNNIEYKIDPVWKKIITIQKNNILLNFLFRALKKIIPSLWSVFNGYRRKWVRLLDIEADVIIVTFHKSKFIHNFQKTILVVHDLRNWDFEESKRIKEKQIKIESYVIEKSNKIVVSWPYPMKRILQLFPQKKGAINMIPFMYDPFNHADITTNKAGDYLYYSSNNGIHKNHENLIKGLALYNERNKGKQLKLICTGPIVKERDIVLQKLIKELGLEKIVSFLGFVKREEVFELYRNAFCIITSTKYEAFSGTMMEAYAFKKPVIGSKIPAITEFLDYYNIESLLFDPDSPEEIAFSIEMMCDNYNYYIKKSEEAFNKLKFITPEYTVKKFRELAKEITENNIQ